MLHLSACAPGENDLNGKMILIYIVLRKEQVINNK